MLKETAGYVYCVLLDESVCFAVTLCNNSSTMLSQEKGATVLLSYVR